MSNDLNRCEFIGRLGRDPEQRFMPSGESVVNFSLAVGWKTKEKDGVEWVSIVVFGKLSEICQKYLVKGSQIYISGRFKTRKWQDKDGNDRYSTEIVADQMQMLGSKSDRSGDDLGASTANPSASMGKASDDYRDDPNDDIPF